MEVSKWHFTPIAKVSLFDTGRQGDRTSLLPFFHGRRTSSSDQLLLCLVHVGSLPSLVVACALVCACLCACLPLSSCTNSYFGKVARVTNLTTNVRSAMWGLGAKRHLWWLPFLRKVLLHGFLGKGALLKPTHGAGERREGAPPRAMTFLSGTLNGGWVVGYLGLGEPSLTPTLSICSLWGPYIIL